MKKFMSMALAAAMCMAMGMNAFAAESNVVSEDKYDLGDGVVLTVVVEKVPMAELRAMACKAGTGYGTASPKKVLLNTFDPSDGFTYVCSAATNASNSDTMTAAFEVYTKEVKTSIPRKTLNPGERAHATVESKNGQALNGYIETTIKAVSSDSVRYYYEATRS